LLPDKLDKMAEEKEVKKGAKAVTKKIELIDNQVYQFEANGNTRGSMNKMINGKIYTVSGSSARELLKKGLGKIV